MLLKSEHSPNALKQSSKRFENLSILPHHYRDEDLEIILSILKEHDVQQFGPKLLHNHQTDKANKRTSVMVTEETDQPPRVRIARPIPIEEVDPKEVNPLVLQFSSQDRAFVPVTYIKKRKQKSDFQPLPHGCDSSIGKFLTEKKLLNEIGLKFMTDVEQGQWHEIPSLQGDLQVSFQSKGETSRGIPTSWTVDGDEDEIHVSVNPPEGGHMKLDPKVKQNITLEKVRQYIQKCGTDACISWLTGEDSG